MVNIGDMTIQGQAVVNPPIYQIVDSRDTALATSTVAYIGVGFKPSYIHIMAGVNATSRFSTGWVWSPGAWPNSSACISDYHAQFPNAWGLEAYPIMNLNAGNNYWAALDSFDVDGITLTWTRQGSPTGTISFRILCFK